MGGVELISYVVLALLGAGGGWAIRSGSASSREATLKRDILDAKAAVPKLESSVRNRDQQLTTVEGQVDSLKERVQELTGTIEAQSGDIISRDRQLRDATSELRLLKSNEDGDAELYDADTPAPKADDEDLVQRVIKAEQRYDSLKRGLIERDDRITELEADLAAGGTKQAPGPSPEELDELSTNKGQLETDLLAKDDQIKQLLQRLEEEAERREVLESMAKTRGEAKVEQRERLAGLEEELPQLRKALAEKDAMIEQRVATISGLRENVADLESGKADAEARVVDLTGRVQTQQQAIAEHDTLMQTMNRTLEAHKTQIETLTQRNTRTDTALHSSEDLVAQRDAEIVNLKNLGTEFQTTLDALKRSVSDRDFKLQTLEGERTQLTGQLADARAELAAAESEPEPASMVDGLTSQLEQIKRREGELQQHNAQLQERVRTLEAASANESDQDAAESAAQDAEWTKAVSERDLKITGLESKLRDVQDQVDALAAEKAQLEAAAADQEAQGHPPAEPAPANAPHNSSDEVAPSEPSNATPLREAEQRIRSLENAVKDRDFRIDGLRQDLAAVEAKLDVYRSDDGFDDHAPAARATTPKATAQ